MQVPYRLQNALRLQTETGIVAAIAVATATFVATPLVIGPLADEFDVGPGSVALFSAAQLGLFVIASSVAGRVTQPSRRLFVAALVLLSVTNLLSAVAPNLAFLIAARAVSGIALGVLTWLAYSQVFGNAERTSDLAVTGPLAAVVASPVFGVLIDTIDVRAVFVVLSVLALTPLARIPVVRIPDQRPSSSRAPAARPALVLVAALGVVTLGGSAVFVFIGALAGDEYGMSAFTVSLVFSANALASIPSARYRGARPLAGAWYLITATCAALVGFFDQPLLLWVLLPAWGFAFWSATPGTYTLLSERSRFPTERAGDAQAAMAAGRAVGPLVGGALVSAGSYAALSVFGAVLVALGAIIIVAIEKTVPPVALAGAD